MAQAPRQAPQLTREQRKQVLASDLRYLSQSLDDFIRNLERTIRLVSRTNSTSRKLEWKRESNLLDDHDLQNYSQNFAQMATQLGAINMWTLGVFQRHPDVAAELGDAFREQLSGLTDRLNSFWKDAPGLEAMLDECLLMLRSAYSIVERIERAGN
jgi:hypothetical protein